MSDAKRLQPGTQEVIVCLQKKIVLDWINNKGFFF